MYNVFVQDEIELDPSLNLTIGSKFEVNEITGLEVQPNARLIWQPNEKQSLWGAISRVVRVPSRADRDMRLNFVNVPVGFGATGPAVAPLSINGNNAQVGTTKMIAFEVGYRQQISSALNFDLATFYYDYDQVITQYPSRYQQINPFVSIPAAYTFSNDGKGAIYGFELAGNWQVTQDWRLGGSYSRAEFNADVKAGLVQRDVFVNNFEHSGPNNMFQLSSQYQVTDNLTFDTMFYWVDALKSFPVNAPIVYINDYKRLDLRLAWQPLSNLELSLVGQNLLDPRHPEAYTNEVLISQVPRSFYFQTRIGF